MFDRRRQFDAGQPPSPPPPIATIPNSHSPSPSVVSVDRSSNSTPHIRRSPPNALPMYSYYDRYRQEHPPINQHHHTGYLYAPPPFDPRYDHHSHPHYQHHLPPPDASGHHYSPSGLPTHYIPGPMPHPPPPPPPQATQPHPSSAGYGHHYPMPGQPPVAIVHTSDANTKLTDGIRRRCFNCCTTDTSTWRRSNLSPGKVVSLISYQRILFILKYRFLCFQLCNKCGLFERTHSRPRPEQFPHKRGALAASSLRGRTPPAGPASVTQLPPLAAATAGGPYQYHHGSLTPLNAPTTDYASHMHQHQHPHPNTLPGLQSWHGNTSVGSASSAASATNGQTSNVGSNGTAEPPLLSRRNLDSPRISSSSSSGGGLGGRPPFDDRLSSNAADPHARSRPPSPPLSLSRSSTANPHHQQLDSHTPPPSRDPQA